MPPKNHVGIHPLPCPRCGYDLRATSRSAVGVRCPECGTLTPLTSTGRLAASRIPWIHRHDKGFWRTFGQTLWFVLAHPLLLAHELEFPSQPRDARRFRLVCLLLATPIATCFLMFAMARWNTDGWWVPPSFRFPALLPSAVLLDHWYGTVPVALGAFAATWLCLELYRAILRLGGGPGPRGTPRFLARRLATMGLYSAALILVETALLNLLWVLSVWLSVLDANHRPTDDAQFCNLAVATLAVALYLWASLPLVLRTGRWRALRAALIGLYPAAAYFLWIAVVTAINWAVGFLVLGIRSMSM